MFAELAARTGGSDGITRASFGEGEQIAHDIVRREGERLGLRVESDAACNLYLTLPGCNPGGRIVIGSHLDSVPLGGNFDGAAGVLCGLSVVSGLRLAGVSPPMDITVMAVRSEESVWFAASYIGSRAAFGLLKPEELDEVRRSTDGVLLRRAIANAGGRPEKLRAGIAFLRPSEVALFIEPHIEQGPQLAIDGIPVGVVSGIRGSFRYRSACCKGEYAHSGAAPRSARRDAVRGAAALVAAMEDVWDRAESSGDDLSITFGKFSTDPSEHAFSKVSGLVEFAIDVRSLSQTTLGWAESELAMRIEALSGQYSVRFELGPRTASTPAAMDGGVVSALQASCVEEGVPPTVLASGAGHDAAVFAGMGVPTGMIFIRNENGSHNPREAMDMEDFAVAARVLTRVCLAPPA